MRKLLMSLILTVLMAGPVWAESALVYKVLDGDTIELLDGRVVHLLGIDADMQIGDKVMDQAESTQRETFLKELIEGQVIELEYDLVRNNEKDEIYAYAWMLYPEFVTLDELSFPLNYEVKYKLFEGYWGEFYVFINATMIKSGHAVPSDNPPHVQYSSLFERIYKTQLAHQENLKKLNIELSRSISE